MMIPTQVSKTVCLEPEGLQFIYFNTELSPSGYTQESGDKNIGTSDMFYNIDNNSY